MFFRYVSYLVDKNSGVPWSQNLLNANYKTTSVSV